MRHASLIVLLALGVGCSSQPSKPAEPPPASHSHPGDTHQGHDMSQMGGRAGTLMVTTDPAAVQAGQPTRLSLMIHDDSGAMLREFEVVHEQKVHLMVVSAGLDQFAHIHPAIDSAGNLTISHVFPTGGTYRLYADYKPVKKPQSTAIAELQVLGDSPPAPALIPNAPGSVTGMGLNAHIAIPRAKAGEVTKITFELLDSRNQPVTDLQPYLGAMGHLVILSADGKLYVHAHPDEGQTPTGVVQFAAHFPQPGIYKAWGQFQRADQVNTVPFVLQVD